jgi:hypothetical protein
MYMRFEVLTVVKMPMLVSWAADGGYMFLQNVGVYLQPKRPTLTHIMYILPDILFSENCSLLIFISITQKFCWKA